MRRGYALLLIVTLLGASQTFGQAPSLENRLREQLRATTNELQTVKSNQAALEARVAAAETDAAKAKTAKPTTAPAETAKLRAAAANANAAASARGSELAAANEKLASLSADLAKARAVSERAQQAAAANLAALTRANTAVGDCISKNARLASVANEILDAYRRINFGTVLASREPFVGKRRLALEQAAQDYDDRLRSEKCALAPVVPATGGQ
jgi:chromosome segregation ATPase